ncbi:MAG: DNA polymerase III subunit gamma/tau [Microbacterium sp.]
MKSEGDHDALSWDGDDALEAHRPEMRRSEPAPAASAHSAPSGSETPAAASVPALEPEADADDETQAIGTVTLLLLGILGGIYLLYTVGWILGGIGMQLPVTFTLPVPLYQGALWLAVLAPALWFIAVLAATRGSRPWVRIVWLVAGAVLLVPWPFVVSGGGAVL